MQIFEVTKKPVNEGILSNIGAISKAVGSAAKSAMAQNLEKTTGVSFEPEKNPYGAKRTAADTAAKPFIDQQAKQQEELWNEALKKEMQAKNVTSPGQLDTASKKQIARSFMNQVHSTLLQNKVGYDYRKLPNYVDGSSQKEAQDIVSRIDNARKSILNFNAGNKTPQQNTADWQSLAQATYDAMSLIQFNPRSGYGSSARSGKQQKPGQAGQPGAAPTQTPGVQKATATLKAAGLTQNAINAVQQVVGPLPPVSSRDQRTMDYLAAIGFDI